MRVIVRGGSGEPADALRVELHPDPRPADGQVVVALEATPIHGVDLDAARGRGPARVPVGGVPGTEGVGRVVEVGGGVDLAVGTRVLLPVGSGTWRDRIVVSAHRLLPVPDGLDARALATASVAPLLAWRLLEDHVDLRPGEWVLQNAASGHVGRHVARLARSRRLRTLNLVRRAATTRDVHAAGGDVVVGPREDLDAIVLRYTDGARVRLALDGVAGDATDRLARSVNLEGTVVTYGWSSGQPVRLDPAAALAREVRWRGCWLPNRLAEVPAEAIRTFLSGTVDAIGRGEVRSPVAGELPLDAVSEAVRWAQERGRTGKILLTGEAWVA